VALEDGLRPLVYHRNVLDLATSVQYVKGIGPRYAAMLQTCCTICHSATKIA